MKTLFKISMLSLVVVFFAACGEDDPANIPFSENTIEEDKQIVENSAIEVANTMNAMKDVEAVDASVSLGMHLGMADPFSSKGIMKAEFLTTVTKVAGLQDGSSDIYDVMKATAAPVELAEDPESIQDVWDELVGIYAWNASTEDWDYTPNDTKIEFQFPSTENGATNNAVLQVTNYSGFYPTESLVEEEYTGDLPESLNIDLTVDDASVMSFSFEVEYRNDGVPVSIESILTMDVFSMEMAMSNDDSKAEASYKFTNGGETVLEMSAAVEGDFSDENIEDNTYTETNDYGDEWEELDAGGVFSNGNFKFQVYNISLNGKGNIKNLADSLEIIYPDDYWDDPSFDELAAAEDEAALINNNLDIWALDEEAGVKIAEAEAYVYEESYGQYTDYWVEMRLRFGDGTYVDLETYFDDGFDQFVAELNKMIVDLNADYDLELEQIDY
ncbi:MAG TPA: hypothetical protein VJ951_03120 [Bacteroidales bacterium]|nr:hypothetical protein [Bacteroidales bacterium]